MRTTSSLSIPSLCAVSGLIATHVFHMTVVVGSGNSCNHGLFAPASANVGEMNGTKKNSPSPANSDSALFKLRLSTSAVLGTVRPSDIFHQPPCCWKFAAKVLISAAEKKPSDSLIRG